MNDFNPFGLPFPTIPAAGPPSPYDPIAPTYSAPGPIGAAVSVGLARPVGFGIIDATTHPGLAGMGYGTVTYDVASAQQYMRPGRQTGQPSQAVPGLVSGPIDDLLGDVSGY